MSARGQKIIARLMSKMSQLAEEPTSSYDSWQMSLGGLMHQALSEIELADLKHPARLFMDPQNLADLIAVRMLEVYKQSEFGSDHPIGPVD